MVRVPQGCCWVEGDNASQSEDSASCYGPLPLALLVGKVTAVVSPPSRWGWVRSEVPEGRVLFQGGLREARISVHGRKFRGLVHEP